MRWQVVSAEIQSANTTAQPTEEEKNPDATLGSNENHHF